MADVFVSYDHDDRATAGALVEALRASGLHVWWDRDIPPSAPWETTIERALTSARAVIVCWSPGSVASENVRSEARWARERDRLIQLFVRPCEPPLFFGERQGVDLSIWTGKSSDPRIAEIATSVRATIDRQRASSEPQLNEGAAAVPPLPPTRIWSPVWEKMRSRAAILIAAILLLGGLAAWELSERLPAKDGETIAVVVRPLKASGSGDRSETALAGGITDELIVRLRQLPELKIATAEPDGSVPSASFETAYVVDGTIRSTGDQLRVTARLLNHDGEILWSQTFDRGLSALFDVQEEIASSIAGALSVSFDVGGNSASYGGTHNPEAYAAYMQYQAHILDPEFDSRPYLQRALALDPKYAKARAALDGDYGVQVSRVATPEKARLVSDMDRNTRAALAANPDLWIPIAARGMYDVYRHNFISADRRFREVAALDKSNDPELRSKLANYEMLLGRVKAAISLRNSNELIDPIQRNDPFRVYDLEMLGKYEDSVRLFETLERKDRRGLGGFVPHAFMGLLFSGREEEAIRFAREHGQPKIAEIMRAIKDEPALATMSPAEVRRWAEQRYGAGAEFEFAMSALYAATLGHQKLAVELMRLAFEGPSGGALWTLWHPAMAKARQTDEFEALVRDLGIVRAWRASGDWGDYCRPAANEEISCS